MLLPYHADVVMDRMPIANWVIMGVTILVSLWGFGAPSHLGEDEGVGTPIFESIDDVPPELRDNELIMAMFEERPEPRPTLFDRMVLDGWSLPGIFTHMFLHAGFWHLLGNMIFLFVFGNAVCAKVGNLWYPLVYCGAGLAAALAHLLFSDGLAVGASGAINGMVGIFLIYYPINEIRCWWGAYPYGGTFSVSSIWLILYWLAFDVLGAFLFDDGVAYAAHLGGFLFGVTVGGVLLHFGIRPTTRYERSLFDAMHGRTT